MSGKKKRRSTRARGTSRKPGAGKRSTPDPRSTFAQIEEISGVAVDEPTFVVVVEPVRLEGDSVLYIQAPHVPPFYLLTAKSYYGGW